MRASYSITKVRNAGIQHWRGLLRDYAVTDCAHMHACVGECGRMHGCACMCVHDMRNHVNA
jgi:hypothetical protein